MLKFKLEKLIDSYKDHRLGYDEILANIRVIETKYDDMARDFNLDGKGRQKLEERRSAEQKHCIEELKELKKSYMESRDEILAEIENKFGGRYRVDATMLDENVVKLLDIKAYKPGEVLELFEQYTKDGNLAMMRYVANVAQEYAETSGNREDAIKLNGLKHKAENLQPIYAEIASGLSGVCDRCMDIREEHERVRVGAEFSEPAHRLAEAWANNKFEEFALKYLERA